MRFHVKESNNNSLLGVMQDNKGAHNAFCPLTQAWRVNCPFNCPITSMTRTLSY